MNIIKKQLEYVSAKITETAEAVGRDPQTIKLIAVSKTYPPETIRIAYDFGQRVFGENRIQELEEKVNVLPDDIEWHLIGHLQSNKAVKAVRLTSWIHTVDSVKLLQRLERLADENGKTQKILIEVNVSGETTKFGIKSDVELMKLAENAVKFPCLDFKGLMTMAPYGAEEKELRTIFANLRRFRDRIENEYHTRLPELSMGMSSDFEAAIKEGATFVRIGTAIFGQRH